MTEIVIETQGLTVFYGRYRGIENLDMQVRQGEVYGFLGPNGAGKTTTQRVLLDIIRPTRGQAKIFGLDCQKEGVQIRQRVGYLPGELSLYPNLRGRDFLQMMAALRGNGRSNDAEKGYRAELCQRLGLDPSRRMREYSRGNKQKVGLVAAFMNKPDLLILDEPTSGLDPLVQQTVLELVREAKADGRTVFFSSHILSEVQEVCDRVGIIRDGRLVKTERVEMLTRQQFKRLRLSFAHTPPPEAFALEGVTETARDEHTVLLEVRQNLAAVLQTAVNHQVLDMEMPPVTLEEIFLAYYGGGNNHA